MGVPGESRHCGKCHHPQYHICMDANNERILRCTICGEQLVEPKRDGYGCPYLEKEEEEEKDDKAQE